MEKKRITPTYEVSAEENLEHGDDVDAAQEEETLPTNLDDHLYMNQGSIQKAIENYQEYKTRINAKETELQGEELQEALSFLDEAIEIIGMEVIRDREEQYGEASVEAAEILIVYADMLIARGRYQVDNLVSQKLKVAIKKKMEEENDSFEEEAEEDDDEDCFELAWGVLELARVALLRHVVSEKVLSPSDLHLNYRMKLARIHSLLGVLNSENDMFTQAISEYQTALGLYEAILQEANGNLDLFRLSANIFHKKDDLRVELLQKIAEVHLDIALCLSMEGIEGPEVLEAYEKAQKVLQASVELRQKAIDNDKSIVLDLSEKVAELKSTSSVSSAEVKRVISEVVTNRVGSTQLGFSNSSASNSSEVNILQPKKRKLDQSTLLDNGASSSQDSKKNKQE